MTSDEIWKPWRVNYAAVQLTIDALPDEDRAALLIDRLPPVWIDIYEENVAREVELYRLSSGQFQYTYDDHDALVAAGKIEDDTVSESRLVAAFGNSVPTTETRRKDDSRLKGWLGPTEKRFGRGFDKGHFIAHSIGGAVDQAEFNVFVQGRRFNRGWTEAGKRYRSMESYCQQNPGVFCFSRPFYFDGSSRPTWLEFGVLKTGGTLWVEVFDNQDVVS